MITKLKNIQDIPLRCHILDGRLFFEIGIDTLAFCAQQDTNNGQTAIGENWVVVDQAEFAKDVVKELNKEDEVGESMLTALLDDAIRHAAENGSAGIDEAVKIGKSEYARLKALEEGK